MLVRVPLSPAPALGLAAPHKFPYVAHGRVAKRRVQYLPWVFTVMSFSDERFRPSLLRADIGCVLT